MTVEYDLQKAQNLIVHAIKDLEAAPEKSAIVELLDAVEAVDNYYRDRFCAELDDDYGEGKGSTYEHGISLEFYIEADWWHDISVALRKLRDRTNAESR